MLVILRLMLAMTELLLHLYRAMLDLLRDDLRRQHPEVARDSNEDAEQGPYDPL